MKYVCDVCGYIYDEELEGTKWEVTEEKERRGREDW